MVYSILGSRFNSLLRVDSSTNTQFYLSPTRLVNRRSIAEYKDYLEGLDPYHIIHGYLGYAQFLKYAVIDKVNKEIYMVDNAGLDNSSEVTERLKLALYQYKDIDGNIKTSYLLSFNSMSFAEWYDIISYRSYALKSKYDTLRVFDHIREEQMNNNNRLSGDIIIDLMQYSTETRKARYIKNNFDLATRDNWLEDFSNIN